MDADDIEAPRADVLELVRHLGRPGEDAPRPGFDDFIADDEASVTCADDPGLASPSSLLDGD